MTLGYHKDPFFMGDMGVVGGPIGPTDVGPRPGEMIVVEYKTESGALTWAKALQGRGYSSSRVFINKKGQKFVIMTKVEYNASVEAAKRREEAPAGLQVEAKPIDIDNYMTVYTDNNLAMVKITGNKLWEQGQPVKIYKEGTRYHLVKFDPAGAAAQRKALTEQELTKKFGRVISVAITATKASADRWVENYKARGVTTAFHTYNIATNKYHLKYRTGQTAIYETAKTQFIAETAQRQAEEAEKRKAEALVFMAEYPTSTLAQQRVEFYKGKGIESAVYKLFGEKHTLWVMQKDVNKFKTAVEEFRAEEERKLAEAIARGEAEKPMMVDAVATVAEAIKWKDHFRAGGVDSAYYVYNPEADVPRRYRLFVWQKDLEQYHRVKAGLVIDPFTAFWNWLQSLFKVDINISGGTATGTVYINDAYGYNMVRQVNNQFTNMGYYSEITRMHGGYIVAFTV